MNEVKALTLEPGKYYRTRDGRRAFLTTTINNNPFRSDGDGRYPVSGFIEGDGRNDWSASGEFYENGMNNHNGDLIAEWVEPKRIKGWLNINRPLGAECGDVASTGNVWASKEHADVCASERRIACIEIDVLEGEGLNRDAV